MLCNDRGRLSETNSDNAASMAAKDAMKALSWKRAQRRLATAQKETQQPVGTPVPLVSGIALMP